MSGITRVQNRAVRFNNKKVKDMIDRGINASAGMLIVNPNARNTAKIGMGNDMFRKGSIHYVGSEIRAVILNKMMDGYAG